MNTTKSIPAMPLLALVCLLALSAARAATYYVATAGNDANPGTQGQPFLTIGKGISTAANGDTILLADGTYNEHGLDFGTKNLALRSQSDNPTACVLDCQQLGNGIFIRGGQTSATTVSGLTIQNAVRVGGTFDGSFGSSTMYVANSNPTIRNCMFINNNSVAANGMLIGSGGRATLTNCTFTSSIAQRFSGSALAVRGNGATLMNCTFSNNGYISLELSSGTSTVTGCNFTGNNTGGQGGGISMGAGDATLTNCSFTGNSAAFGGGIGMSGGNMTLSHCSFTGNDGHNFGGGVAQYGGSLVAEHCTFLSNRVQVRGGAIGVNSGTATLRNCLVARNTSDFGWGCALDLALSSHANVTVINCTFAENFSGGQRSNGVILFNEGNTLTVVNSIFWDIVSAQSADEFVTNNGGTTTVAYSNVRRGYAGTGDIDADPLFVNAAADNYHLQTSSPCINAGSAAAANLPSTDLDGAPRILGGAPDMGAYESTAGVWFVDKASGSDANSGTPTAPFATVTKAITLAAAGNSVYIKQGNYGSDRPRITKTMHLYNWLNTGLARIGAP